MDLLRYDGKHVVITGAATGMGHETTRLLVEAGATVTALDVAEVHQPGVTFVQTDLGDPSSIDGAVAQLPASVDVLMNCAGIPGGTRFTPVDVMKVNSGGPTRRATTIGPASPPISNSPVAGSVSFSKRPIGLSPNRASTTLDSTVVSTTR